MLELKNIHITFNKGLSNPVKALEDINITFNNHEWTYIIGGNASGKTTLLKIISGEHRADNGDVSFNSFSAKEVLFIDQVTAVNIVPSMTIYENLIFGLNHEGMKPNLKLYFNKDYKRIVVNVLKQFNIGLEERLNEQVKFLSGGEQQIIVACRIMLSNAKILLMDEFTSSLDQKWAPFILQKLKKYTLENEIMVIAVTHDFSQIQSIGNRVIMLKKGRVVADEKKESSDLTTQSIMNLFYEK